MSVGGEFGYDFGGGYGSFDDVEREPGFFERRRMKRAARKAERDRQLRGEREQLVESILKKVSESGLHSLTARERRILEEETKRKRTLSG